jgi:hypothetical protein
MIENYRSFEAGPDAFGAMWQVEFKWSQNAISIRHADTVDVKFEVRSGDLHEEKVVALPHPALLKLSAETGHPLTDPWVHRIAAEHLAMMIVTGEDIEKTLVTLDEERMRPYAEELKPAPAATGH